ncbi:MAG: MotA/TolQ/ExbB proton channel family protein [Verrucomicrobiota bacterium]
MKSKRNPHVLFWVGLGLCTGPIWGITATIIGMSKAFGDLGASGTADPKLMAQSISFSMISAAVGIILFIIGVPMMIAGIAERRRLKRKAEAQEGQNS